jgi:hypothetical protein
MPRRHRKTMRGGFLDSISNTLSGWGSSLSQGATDMWGKAKNASGLSESTQSSYQPAYGTYGGKRSRRRMRGGFSANTPMTGIASTAKSLSGGKTRRHRKRGQRTRRH